jgi:3',5'-cyclic AMP phosphodiesterase CpdA
VRRSLGITARGAFLSSTVAALLVLGACGSEIEEDDDASPKDGNGASIDGSSTADGGIVSGDGGGGVPLVDGASVDPDAATSTGDAAIPAGALPPFTTDKRLAPAKPRAFFPGANPGDPTALATYLSQGFGDITTAPGEAHLTRTIDGSAVPAVGANRKRIARFIHLPDLQLADDESPARTAVTDLPGLIEGALRPQEAYMCHIVDAAVRTINRIHRADPLQFVLLGGDNADNAQTNEVDWVMKALGGGDLECDSGDQTDILPGPGNDPKDPFRAEGLQVPWKWITGNHDILVQGNFALDAGWKARAVGTDAQGGTRNYTQGGAVRNGAVTADPKRALLERTELMTKIAADGDGHGIGPAQKASGKAFYTYDVPNGNVRLVAIDTAATTGGASGLLRQVDVDAYVKPALDQARADGKVVILASHHATDSLTQNGGPFGTNQPDAILPDQWRTFIGQYPNVMFSMVGHTHVHQVRAMRPVSGHAWWEVMTSALADFPLQLRVVEIWDQDNGWLMMKATCVDFDTTGLPLAEEGRKRAYVDFTAAWQPDGRGNADDRNVELWIRKNP